MNVPVPIVFLHWSDKLFVGSASRKCEKKKNKNKADLRITFWGTFL